MVFFTHILSVYNSKDNYSTAIMMIPRLLIIAENNKRLSPCNILPCLLILVAGLKIDSPTHTLESYCSIIQSSPQCDRTMLCLLPPPSNVNYSHMDELVSLSWSEMGCKFFCLRMNSRHLSASHRIFVMKPEQFLTNVTIPTNCNFKTNIPLLFTIFTHGPC